VTRDDWRELVLAIPAAIIVLVAMWLGMALLFALAPQ
jgi:hypothetical protein